jgi:hypothetical protein
MKAWTCIEFDGHWPVGVAAVVAAETAEDAAAFLSDQLTRVGLPQPITAEQMCEFPLREGACAILRDGDY